jgi:dihydropteroate synthase
MAILNVTPDSFSDGGQWADTDSAIEHGIELREAGADIVDVGGESTRPGADRVPPAEEQARIIPVITELAGQGITVSVDTMNADTALAAAEAGASIINDVSGGLADPEMYRAVAQTGLHYIAMHWRGAPPRGRSTRSSSKDAAAWTHGTNAADLARYDDVVADVRAELKARIAEMIVWGVDPDKVVLDPGLGFAKTAAHNWRLLGHLDALQSLGHPVLIGASRKRFLAEFVAEGAPTSARDEPTAIVTALAARAGAWGVRVHDVESTRRSLAVAKAWDTGAQS